MDYTTDREYQAAKNEISNALAALDRMGQANAVDYLRQRLSMLNDKQVALTPPGNYHRNNTKEHMPRTVRVLPDGRESDPDLGTLKSGDRIGFALRLDDAWKGEFQGRLYEDETGTLVVGGIAITDSRISIGMKYPKEKTHG